MKVINDIIENPDIDNIEFFKGIILTHFDTEYLKELNIHLDHESYLLLARNFIKNGRESLGLNFTDISELAKMDVNDYVLLEMNPDNHTLEEYWDIFLVLIKYKEKIGL